MFVTIFVLVLIFAIMFHEFGHYATAKAFGMKVEKFFLGFGPTLWSVRKGETEYGVKAIPAGGFVKIIGMHHSEEIDPADRGRTFHEQAAWKRAIVLVSGSVTHFFLAAALIFGALAFIGLPDPEAPPTNILEQVVADSPAAQAGLQPGDRVVAIDGAPTGDFEQVRDAIQGRAGESVEITLARDDREITTTATLATQMPDGTPGAFLGVGPRPVIERVPAGEALVSTVRGDLSIFNIAARNIEGLGTALSPSSLANWFRQVDEPGPRTADGPVSLVGVGQTVSALGRSGDIFNVLFLLALLNITLGTLNMLPLPPLDGGHFAVLLIEQGVNGVRKLRGKAGNWQLDPSVVTPIALAVIVFFVVLSLTALYVDIVKPASQLLEQ
ncbi:MAG TPA: RIP metalloprotease [Egibacteraceae bacterium]|nr:RIP metalloprotease [Egibacteraceae bacterium]